MDRSIGYFLFLRAGFLSPWSGCLIFFLYTKYILTCCSKRSIRNNLFCFAKFSRTPWCPHATAAAAAVDACLTCCLELIFPGPFPFACDFIGCEQGGGEGRRRGGCSRDTGGSSKGEKRCRRGVLHGAGVPREGEGSKVGVRWSTRGQRAGSLPQVRAR